MPEPPTTSSRTTDPDTALPSVLARVLAFGSIFIGAAAGAMIGYAFAELGRFGQGSVGFITFLSMLLGAAGVAVVAVLTLRAFGEWDTIRERETVQKRPPKASGSESA